MFRACHAHRQEKTNCINTASGNCHSVLVAVSCAGREFTSNQHTTQHRCGWFGGVAAYIIRCILTDYFNNYNFSKLK